MARVVKVFRTLRNHWKKSTFAVCVLSYGGHWLYGKHCDNLLRREACLEARVIISPMKATVLLNPAASKGKANNLFEKNAAPILHLAGVDVTIVKTDYEGQAKKLIELMEQTDMLIVAGGDGTLQEVITGLLRRPDQDKFSNTPIGYIPLGSHNSLSPSLHLLSDNRVSDIISATLSILKGETVPLDVLQIKGEREQPVFALMSLRWGAFRDVASSISKYWYLGPLKTKAAHWFRTLQVKVTISFLPPDLRPPDLPSQKPPRPNLLYRIIRRLKNYWNPPRIYDSFMIAAEPDDFTVGEFITVGSKKEEDPTIFTKACTELEASACMLQLPEGTSGFYNIDNEEYEAMPVEVRLLPRKLHFFISAERRDQLQTQMQ
uniref:Acylglycerol kinase, mitochondrial n=1 Tax=Neogobius melanostomus TaxID=47308 RepID=A0A8C6SH38_9GOBI